jgi:hypothetical protein
MAFFDEHIAAVWHLDAHHLAQLKYLDQDLAILLDGGRCTDSRRYAVRDRRFGAHGCAEE